jgi:AAA family ATP:ADP antiporter
MFIGFFSLFIFGIYPNKELFSLDYFGGLLLNSSLLPQGYKVISVLVQHWYCSVFYVFCELWGTVMLSMLFWGYANEVTSVDEAKRFYAIFALGSNLSGIFSGIFGQFLVGSGTGSDAANWDYTIKLQIGLVLGIACIIIGFFYFLSNNVFAKEQKFEISSSSSSNSDKNIKTKEKLSLVECFKYLARSPYLTSVVIIVVSYNLLFNLCDVLFTHHVKEMYPDTNSFNKYMNLITSGTGLISVVFAFVVSGNVLRFFGWIPAAMITPVIWIFTTIGFMCGMILPMANAGSIVLFFGALQMCLGRASKYTVFDETKEIVFIPLSKEEQRKGKAVVDGIASRFGKTGGSIVYLVLLGLCGSIPNTVPYVAVISCIVMFVWIYSVFHLGKMVKNTVDAELNDGKKSSSSAKKSTDQDISTAVPA